MFPPPAAPLPPGTCQASTRGFVPGDAAPIFSALVAAGFPSPADDHLEGQLDLHDLMVKRPAATFFCRADGDSMTGAGIQDGDLLVVDRTLFNCVKNNYSEVTVGELVENFIALELKEALKVDRNILLQCFLLIGEIQRKERIIPPLFQVSESRIDEASIVRISDRRFTLALNSMSSDDFDEWLDELSSECSLRPKKRANVSPLSDEEAENIVFDALPEPDDESNLHLAESY